jgi:hypothetical protein
MALVVHVGYSLSQWLDASGRAVLSSSGRDVDGAGSLEAALDIVLYLGSSLAKVGPLLGSLQEAIFGGTLSAPDDTSRGTSGIQTGVRQMSLVGSTELSMDLGRGFCLHERSALCSDCVSRKCK